MDDERYPIGKFVPQETYTQATLEKSINEIEVLPELLAQAIQGLAPDQLDTPYREGGWTIRQVVHHLADSHMNAYIRTKWALTEEAPLIKAYNEKAWAETPETKAAPELSLAILKSLHDKWAALMRQLSPNDLSREFVHPETRKSQHLDRMISLYAWHGAHHLAHITQLKKKRGWK